MIAVIAVDCLLEEVGHARTRYIDPDKLSTPPPYRNPDQRNPPPFVRDEVLSDTLTLASDPAAQDPVSTRLDSSKGRCRRCDRALN